jgi:Flp pilus assembly protein TadG
MTRTIRQLTKSTAAQTGVEFTLILPILLFLLLGFIDAARLMWTVNRAEKATQMGVRYAVTTDMIAAGLGSHIFTESGVAQGDPVPISAFGGVTCTSTVCTNKGAGPVPGHSAAAFNNLLARMRFFYPEISAQNLVVDYDNSGIGYSGDPNAPDVAALVTVRLVNITFQPISTYAVLPPFQLPEFRTALTMEDGTGTVAN